MAKFNAELEAMKLKAETDLIRQRTIRKSKLVKYVNEITALYSQKLTATEIHRWLNHHKRVSISVTSVRRFINAHVANNKN